ncbi:MAG TPA: hypothetical protein VKH81_13675 [Candidatus Angelobacter sp.]|nr:hypothetical protein [Candidatus Angelobacter sp.]
MRHGNLGQASTGLPEDIMLRRGVILLLLTACSWAASFDKPLATKTVDLGPSKYSSGARAQVRCYYFPGGFMVKEVDLGEKGASRLSIIRSKDTVPKCSQTQYKSEMVVNPDEWSGYFKGVKNGLVFFDADDGWNGGMGFAVYDAKTGKKLFSDSAVGPLSFSDRADKAVAVKYERLIEAQCVIHKAPSECWQKIRKDLGLASEAAPDCKAGYEKSAVALAKGRCQAQNATGPACLEKEIGLAREQTDESPSVIVYPAEVVLSANSVVKPLAGDVRCWPAD